MTFALELGGMLSEPAGAMGPVTVTLYAVSPQHVHVSHNSRFEKAFFVWTFGRRALSRLIWTALLWSAPLIIEALEVFLCVAPVHTIAESLRVRLLVYSRCFCITA